MDRADLIINKHLVGDDWQEAMRIPFHKEGKHPQAI